MFNLLLYLLYHMSFHISIPLFNYSLMCFKVNCKHLYTLPLYILVCIALTKVQYLVIYIYFFSEVKFTYNKVHIPQVYHSMIFDKWIHLCNTNPDQDTEYSHQSSKFPHVSSFILTTSEANTVLIFFSNVD